MQPRHAKLSCSPVMLNCHAAPSCKPVIQNSSCHPVTQPSHAELVSASIQCDWYSLLGIEFFVNIFISFLRHFCFFTNAWEKNILPFFCGLSGVPAFASIALRQRCAAPPIPAVPAGAKGFTIAPRRARYFVMVKTLQVFVRKLAG